MKVILQETIEGVGNLWRGVGLITGGVLLAGDGGDTSGTNKPIPIYRAGRQPLAALPACHGEGPPDRVRGKLGAVAISVSFTDPSLIL